MSTDDDRETETERRQTKSDKQSAALSGVSAGLFRER